MTNHYCVRVYPTGEAKDTIRDDDGMNGWVEYNRKWRPGNALFVNGELATPRDRGTLSDPEINYISDVIKSEMSAGKHDLSKPEAMGPQEERYGGIIDRWHGYRPEPHRASFKLRELLPQPDTPSPSA